eukprot:gnl/MRDRNA2_/MRDRNA2_29146_c0_seq1.p1 gnl/MRDRNA2_/MRDRNA2_29146_c0~~gnl/MRDRNA2_/MRDRNA2_29146_c0_seq1.p1  ORF type:complete len:473 (+),score=86.81 gnl/MRDRNA2_/MRDRNA2_29146_c0_seq1:76-1419(+)
MPGHLAQLSEDKKNPVETCEQYPDKYEAEIQGCIRKFVNICKIKDCQKCAWRVHKARLQKRLNMETEFKMVELEEEKIRLTNEKQAGTKRFKWVEDELEELGAMKRPVKDEFADSDEDDSELVMKIEKPFRRERSFDLEKVRVLFGMGPEPPRDLRDPETPRTDRKRFMEVDSDVLAEYQMLQISLGLEKLAFSKPAVADQGKLTYRDIENCLSQSSGKLTRRRCERVFEKLCIQQKMYDAWEKGVKMPPLRSIRIDQRKDSVRISSWYRAVEQSAVLTDYGIDGGEVVKFTYEINKRADSGALDSLCLGVSLRPPVLRYDTAGSTLICIKAKSKTCAGPDFFVFGESMRTGDEDGAIDQIPFEIGPGDRVTFTIDRTTDPEGIQLGSLSVSCNDGEHFTLIHNFATAGLKSDEILFPMAYASRPPVEVTSIAKLIACGDTAGDDDD